MDAETFNNIAGGIESLATVVALGIAGVWTYRRFVKQREEFPFIEFTADIVPIGRKGDWWIVELVSYIENKGKVQHKIRDFCFDLVALSATDDITTSEKWGGQVDLPNIIARGSWLPERTKWFFIEPGVKAKYSFLARVPADTAFLNLHSRFNYPDGTLAHTAERTIEMPACPPAKVSP